MPPRVVADTNVIISALHRGGKPRAVLTLARRGEIDLRLSPFILGEVRGVLRLKFGWETPRIRIAIRGLRATMVRPGTARLDVVRDPADNRILECAVACRAQYLVTGDRDLLELGTHGQVHIVTPAALLSALQ
jgi:uncharacterized protein